MSKFKPNKKSFNNFNKDEEIKRLKKKLEEYEIVTRAVYELVNIGSLQEWNDSYSYGEGVDAVSTLKTMVECNQDVLSEWSYYDWCEWVKNYKPEGLDL